MHKVRDACIIHQHTPSKLHATSLRETFVHFSCGRSFRSKVPENPCIGRGLSFGGSAQETCVHVSLPATFLVYIERTHINGFGSRQINYTSATSIPNKATHSLGYLCHPTSRTSAPMAPSCSTQQHLDTLVHLAHFLHFSQSIFVELLNSNKFVKVT